MWQGIKCYFPQKSFLNGILLSALGAMICLVMMEKFPLWTKGQTFGLSSLTLAIILGMLLGNTLYPRIAKPFTAGVNYAKGQLLRLAIMLYGFKLTFNELSLVGGKAVLIDSLTLSSTFLLAYFLGVKILKMERNTTLLIGSGASICGAAAVIATEPVVKAQSYQVAIAVATVVVFGTISMFVSPILQQLGWLAAFDLYHYGIYQGSTIHEVAQVVVAGNALGTEAATTAVMTKMIRVMMLAPFLLILSFFLTGNGEKQSFSQRLKQVKVPYFAFIFIGVVVLHSAFEWNERLVLMLVQFDNLLLTMAMFALGLTTHFSAIKEAGVKPILLGAMLCLWLIVGCGLINALAVNFLMVY